jgi:hypothetical protein
MHGIKYFFLNKNNQTIQGGAKKKFQGVCRFIYKSAEGFRQICPGQTRILSVFPLSLLSTIIINVLLFYPFARNLSINMFVIKREMIWNIKLVRDLYFYHVFKKNEKRKKDEPLNEMF